MQIFRALVLASILAGCGDTEDAAVDPPDAPGSFAVGHRTFTAVDAARSDRSLKVDVWYPVDAEDAKATPRTRYPLLATIGLESRVAVDRLPVSRRKDQSLIVFSHGYRGINTQSVELMEALASHGFVVASPEHTGNAQSSPTDTFDQAAANRVPDVSFIIDHMFGRAADPEDPFFERLDEKCVGVVGHSFGGMTAIGMAAGWAGAKPDGRVCAIVPTSAVIEAKLQRDDRTGPNAGFTNAQLAAVKIPVMLVGGTKDVNVPVKNNELAFARMVNAPSIYRVDIIGATHTHFANVCAIGDMLISLDIDQSKWPAIGAEELVEPYKVTCSKESFPIVEANRLQNLYTTAFFRRHLLGQSGYKGFLSESYAAKEPAIAFTTR
jgi:predicted dienelactone hydrolase